jgi:hypothetical protein
MLVQMNEQRMRGKKKKEDIKEVESHLNRRSVVRRIMNDRLTNDIPMEK